MDWVYLLIGSIVTLFALSLTIVALLGYKEYKKTKLALVAAVFILFVVKGIALIIGILLNDTTFIESQQVLWIFDLLILSLLYVTSLKK